MGAENDVTDDFDITVGGTEAAATRVIKIKPASGKEWNDGLYRITPDDLKCADVTGTPPVVYEFDSMFDPSARYDDNYIFTITASKECPDSGADVNEDGFITAADFTAWIVDFNNESVENCDQNDSGTCTPADFTAWISNYNMGCP